MNNVLRLLGVASLCFSPALYGSSPPNMKKEIPKFQMLKQWISDHHLIDNADIPHITEITVRPDSIFVIIEDGEETTITEIQDEE